jgi:hypothetical protein
MIELKTGRFKEAQEVLDLMALGPRLKRKLLARTGRMVIAQTKKNQREQKTVSGTPMKPRSQNSRLRTKMFRKMVKGKYLGVKLLSDIEAKVHFFRNAGIVARKHHDGYKDTYDYYDYPGAFDTSKVQTRLNKEVGPKGCTANLAATLIRLQYLPPHLRVLPGGAAAQLRYVMQNMSRKQALFLISEGKKRTQKKRGTYEVPARPVLGVNDSQRMRFGQELMSSLEQRFRAKQYSHLLN